MGLGSATRGLSALPRAARRPLTSHASHLLLFSRVPHAFWLVAGLSAATSAALLSGLLRGVTRFHRVHREMLVSCASLKRALQQVDHASYALRRAGIEDRPAGIGGGVSRAELADAMDSSGMALDDEELDALMDLMDANRDGVLSSDEIRLFRVDPRMSGHA